MPAPEFYTERGKRLRVEPDTSDSELVIYDSDAFRAKCLLETKPPALFQNTPVKVGFRIGKSIAHLARHTLQPRLVVRELVRDLVWFTAGKSRMIHGVRPDSE